MATPKSIITENVQLQEELSDSGYTIEWVLKILCEHNLKFLAVLGSNKVKNVTADEISESKGVLSKIFRIVVEFTDANAYKFAIKVPTNDTIDETFKRLEMDEKTIAKFKEMFALTHNHECDAYRLIENVKNFPRPEIYLLEYKDEQHSGVIAMEYMEKATTTGLYRSATAQQCLNVAKSFGIFQAQMNGDDSWRGKYVKNIHTDEETLKEIPKFMKQLGEHREEFKEPIQRLLTVNYNPLALYTLQGLPAEYSKYFLPLTHSYLLFPDATTISHGDAWANNVMFCTGEDGSLTDQLAAIIDWQVFFEGSPLVDLARFNVVSADAEIRRECEQKTVDLLYDTYCEECEKLGKKAAYTREQAHTMYDYTFITQTYAMLGVASYVYLTNPDKVAENIHKARCEKTFMRAKFCLEDAFVLMEKYKVFERFPATE